MCNAANAHISLTHPHMHALYGMLACVNMMLSSVAASERLRLGEKAMPTLEKSRSTAAEDAGQPRYWRAITSRLGKVRLVVLPPLGRDLLAPILDLRHD